jgi:hypothetical protein
MSVLARAMAGRRARQTHADDAQPTPVGAIAEMRAGGAYALGPGA